MSENKRESGYPLVNFSALSGNLKGALLLVLSGLGFTVYLLINKLMSADVHPVILSFWRAIIGMTLALPFILRRGLSVMATRRPGLVITRSLFGTLGMTLAIFSVSDLFDLTLAQFNAISFTRPLFVTLLAALFLRETVGGHRWSAVFVGFIGVLVMVMPGLFTFWQPGAFSTVHFDGGTLTALISAFSLAAAIILVKFLSGELSPMALLLYANLLSTLLLAIPTIFFWQTMSLETWGWVLTMGAVGFAAQYCYIAAMSVGEASFISPVDYLRLPMASVADFVVLRLIPGLNVWIGAAIIVVSTLYIGWRERRHNRQRDLSKPPL